MSACDEKFAATVQALLSKLPVSTSASASSTAKPIAPAQPAPLPPPTPAPTSFPSRPFMISKAAAPAVFPPSKPASTSAASREPADECVIVATVSAHRYLLRIHRASLVLIDVKQLWVLPVQRPAGGAPALALTEFWVVQPDEAQLPPQH